MNLSKLQNLFDYPAITICDSFVFSPKYMCRLEVDPRNLLNSTFVHEGKVKGLIDLLREMDIDYSTAIISYGANASLKYLLEKTINPDEIFPVIQITLKNYDVVYSSYYCSDGTIPATLIRKTGCEVDVYISFVSKIHLEALNVTENLDEDYKLSEIEKSDVSENLSFLSKILYYECLHGPLVINGKQYSVSAIGGQSRSSQPINQYEVQQIAFNQYFEHDNFYEFCLENIENCDTRFRRTHILKRGSE